MKKMVVQLLGVSALALSVAAQASTSPAQALQSTAVCASEQQKLMIGYYIYASKPKDDRALSALDQSQHAAVDCINAIKTTLIESGASSNAKELEDTFLKFSNLVSKNVGSIVRKGRIEDDSLLAMVGQQQSLMAALAAISREIQVNRGATSPPEAIQLRELALTMRQVSVLYVERATSAYGVTLYRQSRAEPTTDTLLGSLAQGLALLDANPRLPDGVRKRLDGVSTKFHFIQPTMMSNYDKKSLSFSVNYYADSIVNTLLDLADMTDRRLSRGH